MLHHLQSLGEGLRGATLLGDVSQDFSFGLSRGLELLWPRLETCPSFSTHSYNLTALLPAHKGNGNQQ